MLYPLKFKPILKKRVWGGDKLSRLFGKKVPEGGKIGESWELSAVQGDLSVVASGFLKGNNIQELIEVYMGDIVGDRVYEQFGIEFPLLIKFIDAATNLSIQVHPDDKTALERHGSYGKTEMWYIVDREPGAVIYLGFNKDVAKSEYLEAVKQGKLVELLNKVEVEPSDAFLIPAGTVHSIGEGVTLVEIQQTSDITYRIDDWGRLDEQGNQRELHTDLAIDAINYNALDSTPLRRKWSSNEVVLLETCNYFTVNGIDVAGSFVRDYSTLDSFIIFVALEGKLKVDYLEGYKEIEKGEVMLIPAQQERITLTGNAKLIEIYIR